MRNRLYAHNKIFTEYATEKNKIENINVNCKINCLFS